MCNVLQLPLPPAAADRLEQDESGDLDFAEFAMLMGEPASESGSLGGAIVNAASVLGWLNPATWFASAEPISEHADKGSPTATASEPARLGGKKWVDAGSAAHLTPVSSQQTATHAKASSASGLCVDIARANQYRRRRISAGGGRSPRSPALTSRSLPTSRSVPTSRSSASGRPASARSPSPTTRRQPHSLHTGLTKQTSPRPFGPRHSSALMVWVDRAVEDDLVEEERLQRCEELRQMLLAKEESEREREAERRVSMMLPWRAPTGQHATPSRSLPALSVCTRRSGGAARWQPLTHPHGHLSLCPRSVALTSADPPCPLHTPPSAGARPLRVRVSAAEPAR